jgi:hypothetical protein
VTVRGSLIVRLGADVDDDLVDDLVAVIERHPAAGLVEWFDLPTEPSAVTTAALVDRAEELGRQYGRISRRRPRADLDG